MMPFMQNRSSVLMPDLSFWETRYQSHQTPWDLGQASPYLVALLQNAPNFLKADFTQDAKVVVPGCGGGHDAALFSQYGFITQGIDFSASAITLAQQQYGHLCQFYQADVLTLAQQKPEWKNTASHVIEHTCFCAISPESRLAYRDSVHYLLKPGGYLLGVFWTHDNPDGPPYSTTVEQLKSLFCVESGFTPVALPVLHANTIQGTTTKREGTEYLMAFQKETTL
jgi:methyl halide transferase